MIEDKENNIGTPTTEGLDKFVDVLNSGVPEGIPEDPQDKNICEGCE